MFAALHEAGSGPDRQFAAMRHHGRKPPRNEPAEERYAESRALSYVDLADAEGVSAGAQGASRRLMTRLTGGGGLSTGPRGGLSAGPGGGLSTGPGGGLSTGPCGGRSTGPAC
jgi:hypothetical protein